jgi:ABC-type nitrate/sulfonate/bicarbonate transport system ATPase subunit
MIELENIQKSYDLNGKQVLILKGINLFISKGEFVSIMGPSGCLSPKLVRSGFSKSIDRLSLAES